MKPHPRIRKTIKWGGAAVTALLVVVWFGSGWGWINYRTPSDFKVGLQYGRLGLATAQDMLHWEDAGFHSKRQPWRTVRWSADWRFRDDGWYMDVPLWPMVGIALLVTLAAWRLDTLARRRAKGGLRLCPKCGYDRTGILKDAKCPECGAISPSV